MPSLVEPIFTFMYEPDVGPLASSTSALRHGQLHGLAALLREQRGDRLQVDGRLAAEAAPDLHRDYLDLRGGEPEHHTVAVFSPIWKWPWELHQRVILFSSAAHQAVAV